MKQSTNALNAMAQAPSVRAPAIAGSSSVGFDPPRHQKHHQRDDREPKRRIGHRRLSQAEVAESTGATGETTMKLLRMTHA